MSQLLKPMTAWAICLVGAWANAQENFRSLVGQTPVAAVAASDAIQVPFITWGGDVATFLANGDLKTQPGSLFQKAGLNIDLKAGDDFVAQVKDYMAGKSPMLRGTMRMLGQASEVIGSDPRTKPVVVLQLSWSAGDHIVAREDIKTLNDLKGKKIACQQGGPHVGLLFDSMAAAQLTKTDVQIVWTKDLTGPEGAAEAFRSDSTIDACCVITPDLFGLTSGFDEVGSGAEGTVKGAHVINSTQQMSRSIADVIAVRRDWFDANRDWVKKFVAGYLNATQSVVNIRKDFETTQRMSPEYRQLLTNAQRIFGPEVLPTLEVDAHGLLMDCTFVGLPGQIAFFNDKGNLNNFDRKMSAALDLATGWGYAKTRIGFDPNAFDYREIAKLAGLEYVEPAKNVERFAEPTDGNDFNFEGNLDPNTIVSFSINFEPNQNDFSIDRYGAEFQRALQDASTFGNARVVIRGHSDPTKALGELVRNGIEKGLIRQTGTKDNYRYFVDGKPLDIENTKKVVELIESGEFSGGSNDPAVTMQAARDLSKQRADAVKAAVIEYAKQLGVNVDLSQIIAMGVGISEPNIPKPVSMQQAMENMRVEFRIVKVDAETIAPSDFDF